MEEIGILVQKDDILWFETYKKDIFPFISDRFNSTGKLYNTESFPISQICQIVDENQNIKKIKVSSNLLTSDHLKKLTKYIMRHENILYVDLCFYLDKDGIEILEQLLLNTSLTLDLSIGFSDYNIYQKLSSILAQNLNLASLGIFHIRDYDFYREFFSDRILDINVRNEDFFEQQFNSLCVSLQKNTVLKSLYICGALPVSNINSLSQMITTNTTLQSLYLFDFDFSFENICSFAKSLNKNTSLEKLILSRYDCREHRVYTRLEYSILCNILYSNTNLREVNLDGYCYEEYPEKDLYLIRNKHNHNIKNTSLSTLLSNHFCKEFNLDHVIPAVFVPN